MILVCFEIYFFSNNFLLDDMASNSKYDTLSYLLYSICLRESIM